MFWYIAFYQGDGPAQDGTVARKNSIALLRNSQLLPLILLQKTVNRFSVNGFWLLNALVDIESRECRIVFGMINVAGVSHFKMVKSQKRGGNWTASAVIVPWQRCPKSLKWKWIDSDRLR